MYIYIYRKTKKGFEKRLVKCMKIFLKKKTKSARPSQTIYKSFGRRKRLKRRHYKYECHKNLSEDEKQRITECKKNII